MQKPNWSVHIGNSLGSAAWLGLLVAVGGPPWAVIRLSPPPILYAGIANRRIMTDRVYRYLVSPLLSALWVLLVLWVWKLLGWL